MNNIPSILAVTDLAARSDRAVDRAILLAHERGIQPVIAHAVKSTGTAEEMAVRMETARAALPDPDADIDIVMPAGPVPQTIVAAAREHAARLIVAAPARFNEPRDYFIGTAVDMIVRLSEIPVLVVKQRPHTSYRRILIATDLSASSRFALLAAAALFPDAELHLIHGRSIPYRTWLNTAAVETEVRAEAEDELAAFTGHPSIAEPVRGRLTSHLGYGDIDRVIDHALRTIRPDLFAAGTHGTGGFIRAAMGSTAAELLRWVPIDMLMVRKPA